MRTAARKAVQAATRLNVWLYRRTNGRIGGRGMGGLPLLLTVAGRLSGTLYTVPVVYIEHAGKHLIVGTGMGGSKGTPQWFRNLAAVGSARIRVLDQDHDVEVRVASAAERDELWDVIAACAPHFDKWQVRIGRSFPVAMLTPRLSPRDSGPGLALR
jgi:deazaflavin-dependent oxidoreductase (nitroreductase family)